MFKFAVALMFGGALVLASDPSFARLRIRMSAPAPKPATVQPAKPGTGVQAKPATAPQTRPAAPVTHGPVFVSVGARPFAAAPAATPPAQRAMSDSAQNGPLQFDPELAKTEEKPAAANVATREPVKDAAAGKDTALGKDPAKTTAATEPPKPQPASKNVRVAQPAPAAVRTARTPAINVCYVQLSGECVPQ